MYLCQIILFLVYSIAYSIYNPYVFRTKRRMYTFLLILSKIHIDKIFNVPNPLLTVYNYFLLNPVI